MLRFLLNQIQGIHHVSRRVKKEIERKGRGFSVEIHPSEKDEPETR